MKKQIPNIITCCNLICGAFATYWAFRADYSMALAFIITGAVFDFFDGFVARLLNVSSPMGKELDSLADDITFGMAPAAIVFSLLKSVPVPDSVQGFCDYIPFAAFLIAAFSGYRLAKFNLDERQTLGFIGLPTPANALFWASLAYSYETAIESSSKSIYFLLAGVLISCWLLVSEVPMFALKFKSFGVRENLLRFVYILLCIILLVFMGWAAIVWLIAVYIVLSIFFVRRHRRGRG